jgi:uncharacterized membrane protein YkoI
MKSQAQATPLIRYMHDVGVPVQSLNRPGRFPTEHLKQAVLDWHDQQLLSGEGIAADDDTLPQPYVKKVQKATARKRAAPKTGGGVAKGKAKAKAAAPDSDGDDDDDRWEIVTGEIGAGNNNPQLLAEARAIARRAVKKGTLTAAQFSKLDAHLQSKQGK